jgi:hypothetical protein
MTTIHTRQIQSTKVQKIFLKIKLSTIWILVIQGSHLGRDIKRLLSDLFTKDDEACIKTGCPTGVTKAGGGAEARGGGEGLETTASK